MEQTVTKWTLPEFEVIIYGNRKELEISTDYLIL